MRTLVIPDIHNHIESAERWITQFPADQIVFLGDYFDSFGDTEAMAEATAHWLKESLRLPNRIHLWGNHDLGYAYPKNRHLRCSGFTEEKCAILETVLTAEDWSLLRLFHHEGDTLFTHAGLDPAIFAHPIEGITISRLETHCQTAMANAQAGLLNPVLDLRGLTWLRWWDMEVLEAFNQVVGHTPDPDIRIEKAGGHFNLCLDTLGHYVGIVEDGTFFYADTRSQNLSPVEATSVS